MDNDILIIGAGGHAKVVLATLLDAGKTVKGFLDDAEHLWGKSILDYPILGPVQLLDTMPDAAAILGLGNNALRKKINERYQHVSWKTVLHPKAYVHTSATIGRGTVIFAGVVIQPSVHIGEHCIVNTGATIDHDCYIGDYTHLAPGVHLAGTVTVNEGCLLGVNSGAIPGRKIGAWTTIGAGSMIIHDIPAQVIATGVPASIKKESLA